ncbi:hypothetical protein ABZ547_17210 [Streptomyces sparsogenes]
MSTTVTVGYIRNWPSMGVGEFLVAAVKRHRAVATRYDKLAVRYEATVLVAAVNEWL